MYTINIYLKLALIALCLVGGTILAFTSGFWYAFPFLLVGLLLLVSYILLGTDEAEQWFAKAQNMKLPSDNERAMILIQMINIHIQKNKWTQATNTHRELKALNLTTDIFKDQIKMIDDAIKQQGKVKMMNTMDQRNMFRPGGKRRMPRMR